MFSESLTVYQRRREVGLGMRLHIAAIIQLTYVANRPHFPFVTVCFVPIYDAAAVLCVNSYGTGL